MKGFNNTLIFGNFIRKKRNIRCTLTDLILTGSLMVNGHINENQINRISKGELWTYLYYLWSSNRYSIIFTEYIIPGKQNYKSFMKLVRGISKSNESFFLKKDIAMCCNIIVDTSDVYSPIIEEILTAMRNAFLKQEGELKKSIEQYQHMQQEQEQ